MDVFLALALGFLLVCATVLIHYEVLRGTAHIAPCIPMSYRGRILVVIGGIFFAHVVEIYLYAAAFYLMQHHFGLGSLAGELTGGWPDFFYFSISCFTTLGIGDVIPTGPMRIVAGIESLNGLVLIGWSATLTYLTMEKTWKRRGDPAANVNGP